MAQQAYAPAFVRRALRAAPRLRHAVWALETAFLALVWGVLALFPVDRASALGRAIARRFGPRLRKHRHVLRNLAFALPDRSAQERAAIAREVWGSLGAAFAEFPHLGRIDREWEERIDLVFQGKLRSRVEPPGMAVFVTAHLANWEISVLAANRHGFALSVVYAPNSTPGVDRLIQRMRRGHGEMVSRQGGMRSLLRALGRGRSLGFLIDTRQDEGEPMPFFGSPALTSTVPARVALRHGIDLLPVRVERLGAGAHFRVTIAPAIEPDPAISDRREQARQMTRRVNELFAVWIRECPEQWLCTKRRWPRDAVSPGSRPVLRSVPPGATAG